MFNMSDILVIRRYSSNRKLYVPSAGRYTNAKEVLTLYKAGYDIEIVDHNSGKDITIDTLVSLFASLKEFYVLQQVLNESLSLDLNERPLKVV